MSTAIWIAIWIAVSLPCCAWLLIVAREVHDLLQPAKEGQ